MDALEARAQIERLTSATDEPVLSAGELDALVTLAKRADVDGRVPTDPNWIPTWDLEPAIAHGWRIKAAAAAVMFDVNLQGLSFSRSQLYAQCVRQAEAYESGVAQAVDDVATATAGTLDIAPPGWPAGVPFP